MNYIWIVLLTIYTIGVVYVLATNFVVAFRRKDFSWFVLDIVEALGWCLWWFLDWNEQRWYRKHGLN